MLISQHLQAEAIITELKGASLNEALSELADILVATSKRLRRYPVAKMLQEREQIMSTAAGGGISFPHCYLPLKHSVFALGISRDGIEAEAPDGKLVHIFLAVISPEKKPQMHLEALSAASKVLVNEKCRQKLMSSDNPEEIIKLFADAEG